MKVVSRDMLTKEFITHKDLQVHHFYNILKHERHLVHT